VGLDGRGARGGLDVMQLGLGDGREFAERDPDLAPAGLDLVDWLADLQPEQQGLRERDARRPTGLGRPSAGQAGSPDETAAWSCRRWWFFGPVAGAGLSDAAMSVLRAAVDKTEVVARYQAKTRRMKGSDCLWWTGAVSARGHCRLWLGRAGDRGVTVIAHRFPWALEHGAASLLDVPVLGQCYDHPLCQRIWPGHMQASSYLENAREWASRRHTIGAPLRDSRGARGRSQSLRDLLRPAERVGLDHVSFAVASRADLDDAAAKLQARGIEHGEVKELASFGLAILSFSDPDGVHLELTAPLS